MSRALYTSVEFFDSMEVCEFYRWLEDVVSTLERENGQ